jgi:hypothetical protein
MSSRDALRAVGAIQAILVTGGRAMKVARRFTAF